MKTVNEIQALRNALTVSEIENMEVHEQLTQDKRKSIGKYFLTINKTSISPVLNYEQMNHFILGFNRAYKFIESTK